MSYDNAQQSMVILSVPPGLEETLVDWLLAQEHGKGFTSYQTRGHSTRHENLSIAEQVSGRQRRLQFQVHLPAARADEFLDTLETALGGAGIHYWVVPVLRSGRLGDSG